MVFSKPDNNKLEQSEKLKLIINIHNDFTDEKSKMKKFEKVKQKSIDEISSLIQKMKIMDDKEESVQCKGITNKGVQCKKTGKNLKDGYCHLHSKLLK